MQKNYLQLFYQVLEQSVAWKADCMQLLREHVLQLSSSTYETMSQPGGSAKEPGSATALIERQIASTIITHRKAPGFFTLPRQCTIC